MQLQAYGQKIRVMRCDKCYGIYCKSNVLEEMLGTWMSEALDCGSKSVGKEFDKIEDIDCPACQMKMDKSLTKNNRISGWNPVAGVTASFWTPKNLRTLNTLPL